MIFRNLARALCGVTAAAMVGSGAHADVVISSDPTQNMSCTGGVCSPTEKQAVLNISDLTALLAASDATVDARIPTKKGAHYAGPIELRDPLSWANASKLTLNTPFSVSIEAPVSVLGPGGLIITHGVSLAHGSSITFADLDSAFYIGGVQYTLIGDFPTLASDIKANSKGTYALANDYDAGGDRFRKAPIATFGGTLLGLGHTISNLTVRKGRNLCEGMIGTSAGYISNLSLANVLVNLDTKSHYAGGIVGCNQGELNDVMVSGRVVGSSGGNAGGITGTNSHIIQNAISVATVSGGQAGGIAGENDSSIVNASASGTISGVIDTGGLVGLNTDFIDDSYATGAVSGSQNNTGGLVGSNHGAISYCYATGNLSGASGASGGFVGFNGGTIQYTYSTGAVTGGSGHTGGFAGDDLGETIGTAYWDTDTSGIADPAQGAGDPLYDPGILGLTTAQLTAQLPFGFDRKHWRQNPGINNGYPYLAANPPQ